MAIGIPLLSGTRKAQCISGTRRVKKCGCIVCQTMCGSRASVSLVGLSAGSFSISGGSGTTGSGVIAGDLTWDFPTLADLGGVYGSSSTEYEYNNVPSIPTLNCRQRNKYYRPTTPTVCNANSCLRAGAGVLQTNLQFGSSTPFHGYLDNVILVFSDFGGVRNIRFQVNFKDRDNTASSGPMFCEWTADVEWLCSGTGVSSGVQTGTYIVPIRPEFATASPSSVNSGGSYTFFYGGYAVVTVT